MPNKDHDELFNYLSYSIDNTQDQSKSSEEDINKTEFYFRGHPDSKYLITPAIFREKKTDEYEVYHEIFRNHYDEFIGMKPIDVLAKMQHYGVPTRLLDITKNPLVASFFSVSDLDKEKKTRKTKSPEVLAFEVEKEKIKNFDSDTVKMLSHLPLVNEKEKISLRTYALNSLLISVIKEYIEYVIQKDDLNYEQLFSPILKFLYKPNAPHNKIYRQDNEYGIIIRSQNIYHKNLEISIQYEKIIIPTIKILDHRILDIQKLLDNFEHKLHLSEYLSKKRIKRQQLVSVGYKPLDEFYFQIQQNYPVFYKCARPLDLLNGVFVTPIVNSDRMRAQQGAFMLFGLSRYWDIIKCMGFLENKGLGYEEIIKFIVEDKPLDDKTNQLNKHLQNKTKKDINKTVREFEDAVFEVKRYKLHNMDGSDVIRKLDVMGVNKQTLGCGMDTTYYNLIKNT